jgi:hypothetical protein
MKTNVIVQHTVPSAILKKVIGTIWIRPVNASLYTINEHGHMYRSTLNVNRINYREGYDSGLAAFDDLFLNGLKEKMYLEGSPLGSYVRLVQMIKDDSMGILSRQYLDPVTNLPHDFYESTLMADFMKDMFLSAAKFYDPSLPFEAPIGLQYLQMTSQLEAEQWDIFNLPHGGFFGEKRKNISQFLLQAAEASRVFAKYPSGLGVFYIMPTIITGQYPSFLDLPTMMSYLASIYDRIMSAMS